MLVEGAPGRTGSTVEAQGERCFPLRSSRPVVDILTQITFSPAEIPVHEVECSYSPSNRKKEGVNITVCFQVKPLTLQFQGQCRFPEQLLMALGHPPNPAPSTSDFSPCPGLLVANLTYTLQLDGHRSRSRGLFLGGRHELSGHTVVTGHPSCTKFWFHFPVRSRGGCPRKCGCGGADHGDGQQRRGLSSVTIWLGHKALGSLDTTISSCNRGNHTISIFPLVLNLRT